MAETRASGIVTTLPPLRVTVSTTERHALFVELK
jgi:hypothetical protein